MAAWVTPAAIFFMNDPQNPALAAMMQRAVAERVYNFSPGPAALPAEVLQQAAEEMLSGMAPAFP